MDIFYNKILHIERILKMKRHGDGREKNKLLLACAIYYKLRMGISYRDLPMNGVSFGWSNVRYWINKLRKSEWLPTVESIVEGY